VREKEEVLQVMNEEVLEEVRESSFLGKPARKKNVH